MRVKNFLKSAAHEHSDPAVRRDYVRGLDASEPDARAMFATMATNDADVMVRCAAIARLDDLALLRELLDADGTATAETDNDVTQAATARLLQLLGDGKISDIAARALLASHANLLAVPMAVQSAVADQRSMALTALRATPEHESALLLIV